MRNIFLITFFAASLLSYSQFRIKDRMENFAGIDDQPFSWGYYLGVNMFDYKLHPNENGMNEFQQFQIYTEPKMGFHAGLMGRWKLNDHFDFRSEPGIYFVQRDMIFKNFTVGSTDVETGYTFVAADTLRNIKSTYIDVPIFLNLHGARWYNTRPYMQAGVSWMVNLQSNEKKLDDNLDEVWRSKTHNFTWQFELGVEIYLKWFKLTPAVKGIFFFNNEWVPDNQGTPNVWSNAFTGYYTRAYVFSLKFE